MAAAVEVLEVYGGTGGVTIFGVAADERNWIRFRQAGGQLLFERANGGETSAEQVDYDAEAHRWWRLAHVPGDLRYEVSRDGLIWTVELSVPQPAWIDDVCIELQAGSDTSDENHGVRAVFGSFTASRNDGTDGG
jgi:hypothetical protein